MDPLGLEALKSWGPFRKVDPDPVSEPEECRFKQVLAADEAERRGLCGPP